MANVDKTIGDVNGLNNSINGPDNSRWVCKSIVIGNEIVLYCQDTVSGLILVSLDQNLHFTLIDETTVFFPSNLCLFMLIEEKNVAEVMRRLKIEEVWKDAKIIFFQRGKQIEI